MRCPQLGKGGRITAYSMPWLGCQQYRATPKRHRVTINPFIAFGTYPPQRHNQAMIARGAEAASLGTESIW